MSEFPKAAPNVASEEYTQGHKWQRRFWEHLIRDEADYQTHIDYIHWNPVKHGLVRSVADWKYSSFHKFVERGLYPVHWGNDIVCMDRVAGE